MLDLGSLDDGKRTNATSDSLKLKHAYIHVRGYRVAWQLPLSLRFVQSEHVEALTAQMSFGNIVIIRQNTIGALHNDAKLLDDT